MTNVLTMPGREVPGDRGQDGSTPPDRQARELALDVSRSWIVEAPAGSGKTGLLVQRFLKLLGQEGVTDPRQVLAIAFTRKSTEEIRKRVAEELMAAAEGHPLAQDSSFARLSRELAQRVVDRDEALRWGLVADPRLLRVQTIDSVSAEIARAMPVLTGGGSLKPVEDAGRLHREAARRSLLELGGKDIALHDSLRTLLLHRDGGLADCETLISVMLGLREQWAEFVPLQDGALTDEHMDTVLLPRLQRALELAICATLTRLKAAMPQEILRDIAALAVDMSDKDPHGRPELPIAVCASKVGLPGDDADSLEHWKALIHLLVAPSSSSWRSSRGLSKSTLAFEMNPVEKARLITILDALRDNEVLLPLLCEVGELPPARFPMEQWRESKALFRVLRRALAELLVVFAERGECDFSELTILAKQALNGGGVGEISSALGMQLEHLLLDEVQDTSTSHYRLVEMLTEGWDGSGQTVFLVGDPKQSIYLFRQARVELFLRVMNTGRLGEMQLGGLRLTANFRSQRGLVDRFNDDFERLFPTVVSTGSSEVGFVRADAVRAKREGVEAVNWHVRVLPTSTKMEERQAARRVQRRKDAKAIRAVIERWQATSLPSGREKPWEIAVLVRNREHLREITRELRGNKGKAAIPFRAVDIEELDERREVLDVFALTRALQHPADRVAWLAIVRAPWCGLELADLHVLAGSDDGLWRKRSLWDVIAQRGELLSVDGIARLQRLWSVMDAAETQRGRLTIAQWVERTWRSLGGDQYLDDTELENVRRYLQVLDQLEAQDGRVDTARLKERLKRLYAESPPRAGAVELLTIHKAKGLEWDVVLVPALERKGRGDLGRLLTWEEMDFADGDAAHVVIAPIEGRGEPARALNKWLKGMHRDRQAAERKRLFYVACTRAREELHLFASPQLKVDGGISVQPDTLLKAAWAVAEELFEEPLKELQAGKTVKFPATVAAEIEGLSIAASEDTVVEPVLRPNLLQRVALTFDPKTKYKSASLLVNRDRQEQELPDHFERPEGSFAARSFGNAVHGFLELMAKRMADGVSADALALEMNAWPVRIEAVLRGDGLPPATVKREAPRVLATLQSALRDDVGCWLLSAQDEAASEYGFTTWGERRSSFRLDRVFVAGPEPLAAGGDCLWIVDYKTGAHGRGVGVDAFLAGEREKYGPQMESYARAMTEEAAGKELRVGLYYPMLPKLLWWKPETS